MSGHHLFRIRLVPVFVGFLAALCVSPAAAGARTTLATLAVIAAAVILTLLPVAVAVGLVTLPAAVPASIA